MKELVCDMCGSNNIIKQDGLFVCQACNTKYSVEEARKMMFGDVVEVEGTVKIDNSSELANLYELARRARENSDKKYALDYYEQILIKDANSLEAQFYVSLYRLIQNEYVSKGSVDDFYRYVHSLLNITKELPDKDEKVQRLSLMTNEIIEVINNHFKSINDYRKENRNQSGTRAKCINEMTLFINILYKYGDLIIETNREYSHFAVGCWTEAIERHEYIKTISGLRDSLQHRKVINEYKSKIKEYNSK